jgi:hypothetical protein
MDHPSNGKTLWHGDPLPIFSMISSQLSASLKVPRKCNPTTQIRVEKNAWRANHPLRRMTESLARAVGNRG